MLIMKKLTAIFLCFAMALSLAACGNTTSSTNESSTPESSVPLHPVKQATHRPPPPVRNRLSRGNRSGGW